MFSLILLSRQGRLCWLIIWGVSKTETVKKQTWQCQEQVNPFIHFFTILVNGGV